MAPPCIEISVPVEQETATLRVVPRILVHPPRPEDRTCETQRVRGGVPALRARHTVRPHRSGCWRSGCNPWTTASLREGVTAAPRASRLHGSEPVSLTRPAYAASGRDGSPSGGDYRGGELRPLFADIPRNHTIRARRMLANNGSALHPVKARSDRVSLSLRCFGSGRVLARQSEVRS